MENRRRQMQHFLTPQHPSSTGKSHLGGCQHFVMTPQHPNQLGTDSQRSATQLGYYESPVSSRWGGEVDQLRTPLHKAASVTTNYWGTVTETRQFGTPQHPSSSSSSSVRNNLQFGTPQHPSSFKNYWGTVRGTRQFGTPQRPGSYGLEFRTPRHPSVGTNNWGGASPLLARNIPQESLDQRYDRLYANGGGGTSSTTGTPAPELLDEEDDFYVSRVEAAKYETAPASNPQGGLLWKFMKRKLPAAKNKNAAVLDDSSKKKKKRWFPKMKLDVKKRWPHGWI